MNNYINLFKHTIYTLIFRSLCGILFSGYFIKIACWISNRTQRIKYLTYSFNFSVLSLLLIYPYFLDVPYKYLSIILNPLLGAIISSLYIKYFNPQFSKSITSIAMILSAFQASKAFMEVGLNGKTETFIACSWITCDLFTADWGFLFDSLTVTMLLVVTFVSTLVHIYSCSYMNEDPQLAKFMCYISLFTFFMLMLVTANNFLQLFFGWEGVGLCSFLLISFWHTRIQANKAAIKAMVVNRIGDFGLLFGILIIFQVFKTIEFGPVFSLAPYFYKKYFIFLGLNFEILSTIGFLLFIGAMGKSAQIGLHTWLPDAMEGPTPVSALIHAATMVTAGVFLIIRCSPIFEYTPSVLTFITCVGALTAFFAASIGLVQNDIKKIIAYSTCSQLGYMIFACGLSGYNVSLFHLFNHAFFKALLFLSAGAIIHGLSNEQDLRKMGGLLQLMPFTYMSFIIGSLALMGFPFLAGFYSKDVILEIAYAKYSISGTFSHWLGIIAATFTAFYSLRLLYWIFLSSFNGYKSIAASAHEIPTPLLGLPLFLLSGLSLLSGYLFKDLFIGLGTTFFRNAIFVLPNNYIYIDAEFIPTIIKLLPIYLSIEGAILAYYVSKNFNITLTYWQQFTFYSIFEFLNNKWHFDTIYNYFINKPLLNYSYTNIFKGLDKEFLEFFGPSGLTNNLYNAVTQVSSKWKPINTISDHLGNMLITTLLFILIIYLNLGVCA